MPESAIPAWRVVQFTTDLLSPAMHFKRAKAIGRAVVGIMHADRLSCAAVGREVGRQFDIDAKHGIKVMDRLIGNSQFDIEAGFSQTVPWLVAQRRQIVVSIDWTEYPADGHSRVAINLVSKHGRATPLVWKTVETRQLRWRRNRHEDDLLHLLGSVLPEGVGVTLLADRGFGDTNLYSFLRDLGWDFVIRFRGAITVRIGEEDRTTTAAELVPTNGRARVLPNALVTAARFPVGVVCVKRKDMKEPWCLATSRTGGEGHEAVKLYGRRFTCEESFRDEKDRRFGYGFAEARVTTPERRDRFLFIAMIATMLLTLLGAAGEETGCDRGLKANTRRTRSHSLLRQGREYLAGSAQRLQTQLKEVFLRMLNGHPKETATFALL